MDRDIKTDGCSMRTMSPKELNDIKFVRDHTVLTPQLLSKMRAKNSSVGTTKQS